MGERKVEYLCQRGRAVLFCAAAVVTHEMQADQERKLDYADGHCSAAVFVPGTMEVLEETTGLRAEGDSAACQGCRAKIGRFSPGKVRMAV